MDIEIYMQQSIVPTHSVLSNITAAKPFRSGVARMNDEEKWLWSMMCLNFFIFYGIHARFDGENFHSAAL